MLGRAYDLFCGPMAAQSALGSWLLASSRKAEVEVESPGLGKELK